MTVRTLLTFLAFLFLVVSVSAQDLDLLIDGGHVIDPKNGIDQIMDVGIADGRIAEVAVDIPAGRAATVVDASGLYVTPGLIDLHVHAFHGTDPHAMYSNGFNSLPPDAFTFRSGVTTAVDAGSSGWRDVDQFIEQTIDHSDTRILAFLNIVGSGMKGGVVEQNQTDMNPQLTALSIEQHSDVLVGVKLAHYMGHDWTPTERAVEAARLAGVPLMVDFGGAEPALSIRELFFDHMRPGDIFTHAYGTLGTRESIVEDGELRPFVPQAQERGIIFDVGHGGGSLHYSTAIPATRAGFWPNTISTDLHTGSMNDAMQTMAHVMSKMLALGMPLGDVIMASTWKPAQVIHREELGNLDVGAEADVAVLRMDQGDFGYYDVDDYLIQGDRRLEAELTLRAGRVVWDRDGISKAPWAE